MGARSTHLHGFEGTFAWSLLESVPDGIVIVSGSGDIVFVNDRAAHMMGYEPDELLDHPIEELLPEAMRSLHRAHRTRYRADPVPRSMGSALLLAARRADGSEFPVEISLSPWPGGGDSDNGANGELHVMAAIRDVTKRVDAEDHLHRVLHTLDASDDGVFIFDADDLHYSYVNDGAARLVGYGRDELLAMTPLHLNSHATETDYRDLVEMLQDRPGEPVVHLVTLMRRDGVEIPVEKTYKAGPIDRTGSRWVIALARDITAQLTAVEQLRSSEAALRHAEAVLAIAHDRERIARDLHDTVIQRLFGAGMNLQATAAIADQPVKDRIETTIDDLDLTIREVRTAIFSLQNRAPAPAGVRGRLRQVIIDAREVLGLEPGVELDERIEGVDAETADHLVAILREAISNVARHAGATAVNVAVSVSSDDVVSLSVADNGIGVAVARRRRGDPGRATGNGLRNMAGRAEDLGGSFELEPRHEGGTLLTVYVPLAVVAEGVTAGVTAAVAPVGQ